MGKSLRTTVLLAVMTALLSAGCAQNTAGEVSNVSGGAVTGGAVSGETVSGNTEAGQTGRMGPGIEGWDFYANSACVYREYIDKDETVKGITQYAKSGEEKKTYKIEDCEGLLAVTDREVYYAGGKDGSTATRLCRIPVSKTADGEELQIDRTEVVLTDKKGIQTDDSGEYYGGGDFYMDEDYIVWISEGDYIGKYDRKTGKKVKIPTEDNMNYICGTCPDGLIIIQYHEGDGIFKLPLTGDKLEEILPPLTYNTYYKRLWLASGDGNFFYLEGDSEEYNTNSAKGSFGDIWVWQGDTGKKQLLVPVERIKDAIAGLAVPDNPYQIGTEGRDAWQTRLVSAFYQRGALYLQFQTMWWADKKCWDQNVVFSVDISEWDGKEAPLHYEKTITELFSREGDSQIDRLDKDDEAMYGEEIYAWNSSEILGMEDGKAILNLYQSDGKYKGLTCYDLATGKYYRIERDKSGEYLLLFYNEKNPLGMDESRLEGYLEYQPPYL